MAGDGPALAESSLKMPATEIVDLSEDSSADELIGNAQTTGERDASPLLEAAADVDEDDDDQWSLYEDALEGMGDGESLAGGMSYPKNLRDISH